MKEWMRFVIAALLLLFVGQGKPASGEHGEVCAKELDTLDAAELFLCANCYANGGCAVELDDATAIRLYERAGEKGLKIGYSTAAWLLIHQEDRSGGMMKRIDELTEKGRGDSLGLSDYLRGMKRLALASSSDELVSAYNEFQENVYSKGMPANLLGMYFMLEQSTCQQSENEVLVRQKRLLDAIRYEKSFDLQAWNEEVEKEDIEVTLNRALQGLNQNWDPKVLKEVEWCERVARPTAG